MGERLRQLVVDDGEIEGVVTDRDMYIALATRDTRAANLKVGAVATKTVVTCVPEDDVHQALTFMKQALVHRLPVVGFGGRVLGIVSVNDLILAADVDDTLTSEEVLTCSKPSAVTTVGRRVSFGVTQRSGRVLERAERALEARVRFGGNARERLVIADDAESGEGRHGRHHAAFGSRLVHDDVARQQQTDFQFLREVPAQREVDCRRRESRTCGNRAEASSPIRSPVHRRPATRRAGRTVSVP